MNTKNLSDREAKKIALIYEKNLRIPKKRRGKQILVCPIGLVGAGKTTVVKPLSRKLSLLHISTDEIRILLKKNGFDWARAREIAYSLVKKYLRKGFSVAIDADCISKKARDYIKEVKKELSIKVVWIHINPPEKFIINKLKNYKEHSLLFKDSEDAIANYLARKPLHKKLNFPFIYTFDPSRPDLKFQLKEAASIIKRELLT